MYWNHSLLVIFVNNAKYIHFYPTFQLPPTISHGKYEPFVKSIKFCLFGYKYWLKCLPVILLITDLSYSLSNYIQFEVFENCLKWVAYISTLFSPCYHLGRNGKLLKCLRILITVIYFTDRNWIFKTVHCISSLGACKIASCSEFPDIPDRAGRKTRRRSTQSITKGYAFHANVIIKKLEWVWAAKS